jgi:hypothetical protein
MQTAKINRVLEDMDTRGEQSQRHVLGTVLTGTIPELPARQIAEVANIRNAAYHEGRTAAGVSIEGDALWYGGRLIPLAVLDALHCTESVEIVNVPVDGKVNGASVPDTYYDAVGNPADIAVVRAHNGEGYHRIVRHKIERWTVDYTERM